MFVIGLNWRKRKQKKRKKEEERNIMYMVGPPSEGND